MMNANDIAQHNAEATLAGHKPKLCAECIRQREIQSRYEAARTQRGIPRRLLLASDSTLVRNGFAADGLFGTW